MARNQFETTTELLNVELESGYVIGPFNQIPYEHYRISPLGVGESKYSKKKRLTVDLSAPHDNEMIPSLNQLINKEYFSLSYVKIGNTIKIIRDLGEGALMCKADIKEAFKIIPIKESLWPYHGVKWDGKYYFYT